MKIKGSFLQKFLLVVQVVFMLTAIGIDIYMNVKHNYNLAIANISKTLLYFCIGLDWLFLYYNQRMKQIKMKRKAKRKKTKKNNLIIK